MSVPAEVAPAKQVLLAFRVFPSRDQRPEGRAGLKISRRAARRQPPTPRHRSPVNELPGARPPDSIGMAGPFSFGSRPFVSRQWPVANFRGAAATGDEKGSANASVASVQRRMAAE